MQHDISFYNPTSISAEAIQTIGARHAGTGSNHRLKRRSMHVIYLLINNYNLFLGFMACNPALNPNRTAFDKVAPEAG